MTIQKGFNKNIKKRLKEGTLKFVGFVSEEQAKKLNKKYVCVITNTTDLLSDVLGIDKRNVYVYKELTQQNKANTSTQTKEKQEVKGLVSEFKKTIQEARRNPKLKDLYILPTFIIKFNNKQKREIKEEAFINSFNVERLEHTIKEVIVRNENITFKEAVKQAIKNLLSLRKTLERSLNKK